MEVDKWYRWRMALSSVRESISFLSQSGACEFQLLAKDGIYLTDAPRTVPAIILSPGNKADVAVRCSKVGQEYMNATDLAFDPKFGGFNPETQFAQDSPPKYQDVYTSVGNFHDPELQPIVMVIDVVSAPGTEEPDVDLEPFTVPTPCYLVDLRELNETEIEIGHFINEYWCKNPGQGNAVALPPDGTYWPSRTTPDDTCGVFGPYGVGGGLTPRMENLIPYSNSSTYINDFEVGSIQEIDLVGVLFHPYHQHINPFQIQEVFNNADASVDPDSYTAEAVKSWYQVGDWQDTLQLPALKVIGTNDGLSRQTAVKVRFQVDQFTGHMLQHCHLLFHEDQGMMAQYDMRGDEGTTWDGARDIDRTCIKPTTKKGLNTTSQPSDQLSESPSFSATPSSLPSVNPSLMDNKLLISMNPSTTGTGKWYVSFPDEYCLQDCKHSGAGSCGGLAKKWDILYNDAASCCQTKLPYKNLGWCTETSLGNSFPGSGKFYADQIKQLDRTCIKPTTKKGLNTTSQPSDQLSESPSFSATPSSLPSVNPSLMDNKLLISMNPSTTGTGKWYVSFPDEYCLQDCKHSGAGSCGGLAKKWDILYNDAASCCQTKLPYKNLGWCTGTSLGNSFPGSGKFYADQIKQTCTKDCVSGGPLDGDSECGEIIEDAYVDLYDSIIECCRQKLSWQNVNLCASSFNPSGAVGSGQWYVDWELRKCVKDCVVGGTSCGGLKDNWDVGHATAETCCAMISWVPRDQCHT
eukprot:CAMPEP_0201944786 /NCGR_PEP_ID=MMETSP0903-20130614/53570_1 /ASSEMBLY_ACC=CAM_ASM_000552 /TAXON_ID=420261 /ORGANISM="Thalassiosira antarctica, Strain CCMP982" /LENGTH=745 /DNA_ID=CAMNT_0048487841 /DNA_START=56 /DNA_END=2294 /DNA_ORIENTATION=+